MPLSVDFTWDCDKDRLRIRVRRAPGMRMITVQVSLSPITPDSWVELDGSGAIHVVPSPAKGTWWAWFDAEVEPDEVPGSQPDVEQRMHRAERERIVEDILAEMPREAAMLIRWLDLGEITYVEVAAILKCPGEAVKTQHRRARDRFGVLAKRRYKEDLAGGA